jgi:hypothetical protein
MIHAQRPVHQQLQQASAKNCVMPEVENDTRPGLAIVVNSITPYNVHLARLIAAGIPELKLHMLITHWAADFKWDVQIPPDVHLARFGAPNEHPLENPLRRPVWDWRRVAGSCVICARTTCERSSLSVTASFRMSV